MNRSITVKEHVQQEHFGSDPSSSAGLAVACVVQWTMVDDRPRLRRTDTRASYQQVTDPRQLSGLALSEQVSSRSQTLTCICWRENIHDSWPNQIGTCLMHEAAPLVLSYN